MNFDDINEFTKSANEFGKNVVLVAEAAKELNAQGNKMDALLLEEMEKDGKDISLIISKALDTIDKQLNRPDISEEERSKLLDRQQYYFDMLYKSKEEKQDFARTVHQDQNNFKYYLTNTLLIIGTGGLYGGYLGFRKLKVSADNKKMITKSA